VRATTQRVVDDLAGGSHAVSVARVAPWRAAVA
jgi:hypothetical protein